MAAVEVDESVIRRAHESNPDFAARNPHAGEHAAPAGDAAPAGEGEGSAPTPKPEGAASQTEKKSDPGPSRRAALRRGARTTFRAAGRANAVGAQATGINLSQMILAATGVGVFVYLVYHPAVITAIAKFLVTLMQDVIKLAGV